MDVSSTASTWTRSAQCRAFFRSDCCEYAAREPQKLCFFFVFVASVYRAAGKSRASSLHVRAQPRRRRWVHGEAAGSGPALHGVLCRAACFVFVF